MSTNKIQIDFLVKGNDWLSDPKNHKKFALTEADTNPHISKLCIYILGGWAINRYSYFRKTNDIDMIASETQVNKLLTSFNYTGEFKPISSPDSNEIFTQKHTLKNASNNEFSLEIRFFNPTTDEINFGNFKIDRNWLFEDSIIFDERIIKPLPYVRVPSLKKLIALKLFSIVGRGENDKEKIITDFIDIHSLQISPYFNNKDISLIFEILKDLSFQSYNKTYTSRLNQLMPEIQSRVEDSIKEDSILYKISGFSNSVKSSLSKKNPPDKIPQTLDGFQYIETILTQYDDWLVGALNFDEDLHFSSFYLDQSWDYKLPSQFKKYGYKCLIACYQDFEETYFIPEKECKRVADNLITDIKKDPSWFNSILDKVISLADELVKVFPFSPDSNPFNGMRNTELIEYYSKHNITHSNLYVYSRLPEALDRGKNYFTDTLKNYLKKLHSDFSDITKLNEAFEIFTFPEDISIAGQEFIEFMTILEKIKNDTNLKELFSGSGSSTRKILLKTKPEFLKEIENHRQKWMYWNYHGYGNRVLRDISYFLEKFKSGMTDSLVEQKALKYQKIFKESEKRKKDYYKKYSIDELHQKLFSLYSRIGAVKLYRRYIQLQNFYFLDQLISRISHTLNIEEEIIRNLAPDEIEKLLTKDLSITQEHKDRVKQSAVIYFQGRKTILGGEEAKVIINEIRELSRDAVSKNDILVGEPCVTQEQIIKGHCKVVMHKEDLYGLVFNYGDILVCEAADPDLYDIMKSAAAVLTEQGGVTSHSATYCRENNIKSITGVRGLLDNIFNNDLIEVDTKLGKIYKIASGGIESIITPESENIKQTEIGTKAYNLIHLKKTSFNVPNFFCITIESLKKVLQRGTQDSIGSASQALWDGVNKKLGELDGDLFAIRSSFSNEDGEHFSGAGMNRSELHLSKEDIKKTVISIASEIIFSSNSNITGSIIIQQMILGDISGIVFSTNPVNKNSEEIILETVPGGNELLTDGIVRPIKFVIEKESLTIKEYPEESIWKDLISNSIVTEIAKTAINIEGIYKKAQDIEWTVANDNLYILQSRPLTTYNSDAIAPPYRKQTNKSIDIISIYRSYRVPENLQRHMLWVTSVAKWIVSYRSDRKKLNEHDILTTLLLHDIGNIVKGLDESFANLFPEGYKFMPYWKAVQRWIKDRYGDTDTIATLAMAKEIGVSERVMYLLEKKQFLNNEFIYNSNDMELKICAYSDQRVSPYGILSIRERLNEAVNRYKGAQKKISVNDPERDKLIELAVKIEGQIFEDMKKKPNNVIINELYVKDLRNFNLLEKY